MLNGANVCACPIRTFSTGRKLLARRPLCRNASTAIAQKPSTTCSRLESGKGRRCFRSVGLAPCLTPFSRTFATCSKVIRNETNNINDRSARTIAAVFAAIAIGTVGDSSDDDRIFGGLIKGPLVSRMTQRRDTSLQIRFGGSVLVDHEEHMSSYTVAGANDDKIVLLLPGDKESISPFLYYLMTQVKLVRFQDGDKHKYHIPIGQPGLGCKYDSPSSHAKIFPQDRRTFPNMVRKELYNYVQRCERCPLEVKLELRRLKKLESGSKISREERLFFRRLWFRMGHKAVVETKNKFS